MSGYIEMTDTELRWQDTAWLEAQTAADIIKIDDASREIDPAAVSDAIKCLEQALIFARKLNSRLERK